MMRQYFRFDALLKFERCSNARVQLPPSRPQQRRVGRILNECVLEVVISTRRETASKHQFRTDELIERLAKLCLRHLHDSCHQFVREFPTYCSTELGDLFGRTEPIKTC